MYSLLLSDFLFLSAANTQFLKVWASLTGPSNSCLFLWPLQELQRNNVFKGCQIQFKSANKFCDYWRGKYIQGAVQTEIEKLVSPEAMNKPPDTSQS